MAGQKEFKKSLNEAKDLIIREVYFNVTKACLLVESEAKKECPFDEGRLRASITSQIEKTDKSIIGHIGSNVDYAPYVHFGTGIYAENGQGRKTPWLWIGDSTKWKGAHWTRGQKPKPFLRDALNNNKNRIEKILGGK